MKKITKICLITSLILILVGGSICTIGAFAGGWRLINEVGSERAWWRVVDRMAYAYDWDHIYDGEDWDEWYDWDAWEETDIEITREISEEINDELNDFAKGSSHKNIAVGNDYTETGISRNDVTELQVDIGGAALYIMEAEGDTFGMAKEGVRKYDCYQSQGRLYLESKGKHHMNAKDEKVFLYIPKDIKFNYMNLMVGGGLIESASLTADEIDLSVGAGLISVDQLESRDLSVEVGAGKVTLKAVSAEEMDLNVGVGHAYVEGNITQEIDVECGMGAVELKLDGEESDFNYDLECSAGSINVGNRSYGALATETYINNSALKDCSLQCAMGAVKVSFTK